MRSLPSRAVCKAQEKQAATHLVQLSPLVVAHVRRRHLRRILPTRRLRGTEVVAGHGDSSAEHRARGFTSSEAFSMTMSSDGAPWRASNNVSTHHAPDPPTQPTTLQPRWAERSRATPYVTEGHHSTNPPSHCLYLGDVELCPCHWGCFRVVSSPGWRWAAARLRPLRTLRTLHDCYIHVDTYIDTCGAQSARAARQAPQARVFTPNLNFTPL